LAVGYRFPKPGVKRFFTIQLNSCNSSLLDKEVKEKMKRTRIMNSEIKKVVSRVKEAQSQLQTFLKNQVWVEEARKYAERQGKEVKKLFGPDVDKLKSFLERERKELERFQKQIPVEIKKFKKFVSIQKKDFEKLLTNVRKMNKTAGAKSSPSRSKKAKSTKSTSAGAAPRKKAQAPTVVSSQASTMDSPPSA
jgi:hypothetical protein